MSGCELSSPRHTAGVRREAHSSRFPLQPQILVLFHLGQLLVREQTSLQQKSLFPSLPLFYHVLKILPAHASHQPGSCCSQLTLLPKARTSQAQAQLRQGQELLCPHRHSHNGCTTTLPPGSSPSPLAHQQLPCLSPCSPFPP